MMKTDIESRQGPERFRFASESESIIIGIGINYKINPKDVEKKLKKTPNFYGVATLLNKSETDNAVILIKNFINELEKKIEELANGKKLKIISEWTKNSETIHKKVTIDTANGKISGVATKINSDGSLRIKTKHKTERVFVGDIIYS